MMWRSSIIVLMLMLVSGQSAKAERIQLHSSSSFWVNSPQPIDFAFVFGRFDDLTGNLHEVARASMNNVDIATHDRHLRFDASTAAELGLDWDEVLSWGRLMGHNTWSQWPYRVAVIKDENPTPWIELDPTPSIGLDPRSTLFPYEDLQFANFEIEAVHLNVYTYYYDPRQAFNSISLFWTIVGNGNVVAEPNSFAVAFLTILGALSTSRRRRSKMAL
jgi:hypothetical protein